MTEIDGIVPVVPTPFRAEDEALDLDALDGLIEFAASLDVSAVCLPAYAGEFYKLSEAERFQVVERAVRSSRGRVAVMAQSNHPSARHAAAIARRNEELGAELISFAVPRVFGLPEGDLLDYCRTVCRAVTGPVLIQDFNPGGPTVGAEFCARLREACPNFRWVKLEEPLLGPKVVAIREATGDEVGVLEGWGGMYLLDLLPSGIRGCIPGLGVADLLARVWRLGRAGEVAAALDLFEAVLPQIVFGLQHLEVFLHLEKRLLVERGVLRDPTVRRPTYTPDPAVLAYGDLLNRRVVAAARRLGPPAGPANARADGNR
ncbi:MAG TPA: dihydrodipicolinate synthase family protein [Chloroflexota bacterium]